MCLGIPGQVTAIDGDDAGPPVRGRVRFGGIHKEVCLAYLPEVQPGDWVIVHAGFAISRIDETEARRVFELLAELAELEDTARPPERNA
jgi:hydrogenase expression/formation protein HypC